MKFITLLTDFGLQDGYPGVMKGVILTICPEARISDITHFVPAQNILEGQVALERSYHHFPAGTIHVAVVDPGVGTRRRPLAMRLGKYYFVGPDNGLFTPVIEQAEAAGETVEIVELNQPRYWLADVSNVFHGRDIFAPVAAHLANGTPLSALGAPISDPVRVHPARPERIPGGWRGQVLSIDFFGNLTTNLLRAQVQEIHHPIVRVAGVEIHGLVETFGARTPGDLVALIGTDHDLEVAVVNGNAAQRLGARSGIPIEIVEG